MHQPSAIELTAAATTSLVLIAAAVVQLINPRRLLPARLRLCNQLSFLAYPRITWIVVASSTFLGVTAPMTSHSVFWYLYGNHIWTDVFSLNEMASAIYCSLVLLFRVDSARMACIAGDIRKQHPTRQIPFYSANWTCEAPRSVNLHLRPPGKGAFSRRLPRMVFNGPMVAGIVHTYAPLLRQAGFLSLRIASPHIAASTFANAEKVENRMARFFPGMRYRVLPARRRGIVVTLIFRALEARDVITVPAAGKAALKKRSVVARVKFHLKRAARRPLVFRGFELYL
jgi:hypothetical protein